MIGANGFFQARKAVIRAHGDASLTSQASLREPLAQDAGPWPDNGRASR